MNQRGKEILSHLNILPEFSGSDSFEDCWLELNEDFYNNHSLLNKTRQSFDIDNPLYNVQEQLSFNEVRVRGGSFYHKGCVWHIAYLVRLDSFF